MKHAYMIIAHGEPELLQLLLERLDDPRNDIYIHLDQKWTNPPKLATKQAKLFLLTKRVDVRWADVSMLEAEYALFHAVKDSGQSYAYHHLLSGVDLPIKTQDYIHQFFLENNGKEFVGIHQRPMLIGLCIIGILSRALFEERELRFSLNVSYVTSLYRCRCYLASDVMSPSLSRREGNGSVSLQILWIIS